MNEPLPRGIFYERERKRFRVRLYRRSHVVWRSYHFQLDEALKALSSALEVQSAWTPTIEPPVIKLVPQTVMDLFK